MSVPNVVAGDAHFQAEVLEDIAEAVRYRSWLLDMVEPYLGDDPLEIGSGTGDYAADLAARGYRITASEAFPYSLGKLYERFQDNRLVSVRQLVAPSDHTAEYSCVVAINVLEHIPDDAAAVRSFAGLLRPGGRVVLWVPAFEGLMSAYDRRVGHQRRYRLDSLRTVLEGAGLEVERLHYVNSLGLVAWFVMMRLLGGQPQAGPALRFWDRFVIPVLRRVESRVHPPFGQSVFAVARRPTLDQPRAA